MCILFTIISLLLYLNFAHSDCIYSHKSKPYGVIHFSKIIYPSSHCAWILELGYYNILEIRIESVNLALRDYIDIHDGPTINSPILMKLYGSSRFRKISTSTGSALIHFQSQSFGKSSAFNITYQIKGVCIPGIQESCSEAELNCYDIRYEKCNSIWNCPISGKDEENCPMCKSKQIKSNNRYYPCSEFPTMECYSHKQRCDGYADCETLADEMYCDPVQCGAHNKTFLCQTFPTRCIIESLRCDGTITCRDGSDEHNCDILPSNSHIRIILVSSVSVILCLLMVVLGFVCICRLHKMRILTTRNLARRRGYMSQYDSSIQQLIDEQMRRGPPPPNYNYALCHSRPFRSFHDLQKIIRSHSKLSGNKNNKSPVNSCQYSTAISHDALQTTNTFSNITSDDPFDSDVQLLIPDGNPDVSSVNNNHPSDVELIDPGVIENIVESTRSVKS